MKFYNDSTDIYLYQREIQVWGVRLAIRMCLTSSVFLSKPLLIQCDREGKISNSACKQIYSKIILGLQKSYRNSMVPMSSPASIHSSRLKGDYRNQNKPTNLQVLTKFDKNCYCVKVCNFGHSPSCYPLVLTQGHCYTNNQVVFILQVILHYFFFWDNVSPYTLTV